jgi:hypothetical protein
MMSTDRPDRTAGAATAARRRTIASYPNYADAERAVDELADRKFPVERVVIVGRGLHFVERVTGRMTYARAALNGAMTGALVGLLVGWLFGLFDWFNPIVSAFWLAIDGLWFGLVVGALFGLIAHALTGGRRDFASTAGVQADQYEVQVDEDVADEAQRLLAELHREPGAVAAEAEPQEPRTGPRVEPREREPRP